MSDSRIGKSETLRRRIITHLKMEWRYDEGGSSWQSFEALARELGAPVSSVKREVRRLAKAGALRYTWLYHEERGVVGAGYILTAMGEREDTDSLARLPLGDRLRRRWA